MEIKITSSDVTDLPRTQRDHKAENVLYRCRVKLAAIAFYIGRAHDLPDAPNGDVNAGLGFILDEIVDDIEKATSNVLFFKSPHNDEN